MLEVTLRRAGKLVGQDRILVVGDARHADLLRAQAGHTRLLLEPEGRNTAAALAVAAAALQSDSPDAVMAVLSADHVIRNEDHWLQAMRAAVQHAHETGDLVTVGTPVQSRETRYGYMVTSNLKGRIGTLEILEVTRFVEKPDIATLESLVSSGACLRNMGMFAWRAATFLEEVNVRLPRLSARVCDWIDGGLPTEDDAVPEWLYEGLPSVSVDVGILQEAGHVAVVASAVERVDVGDFSAFASLWPVDSDGNAVIGHFVASDAHDNIVFAGGTHVAAVGVDDLVIVSNGQSILICHKSRTQDIRRLAEMVSGVDSPAQDRPEEAPPSAPAGHSAAN